MNSIENMKVPSEYIRSRSRPEEINNNNNNVSHINLLLIFTC
jgi:hypothetical protein